MKSIGSSQD
jgi:hypothetical protein